MKRPNLITALVVVSLAIILPYIIAFLVGGSNYVFIGFLINPIDGATYLAKMYEGWTGSWQFFLPYTVNPGSGAYILIYYLFLGHLAHWINLSLIFMYHLARLFGAGFLLIAILQLFDIIFADQPDLYKIAFWLTILGSGMGWTVVFSGILPSDFWVAEAYPFLAMFTNPHFPLGMGLLVSSITLLLDNNAQWRNARLMVNGLLISAILPFALVIVLLVSGVWILWNLREKQIFYWQPMVSLGILGGPYLLYQFWIINTHPALSVWNSQNLTQSPPIGDFLLSFSPAIFFAVFGIYALIKQKHTPVQPVLISWLGLSLVLIYFPFSLQRRFMLGFYIPVTILAIYGIDFLRKKVPLVSRWLVPVTIAISIPTNVLLIIMALIGSVNHVPLLYLSQDEARALVWIRSATPGDAVILASPQMGLLIPAETGRRVIYGHPYETVNASKEEASVLAFFRINGKPENTSGPLKNPGIDYVFIGPREKALGGKLDLSGFPLVFDGNSVQIYQLKRQP